MSAPDQYPDVPMRDVPAGRPTRSVRAREGVQWPVVVLLTVVWCLLWGAFTPWNLLSGAVVSTVVLLVFPLPPLAFDGRVRPLRVLRLGAVFTYELIVASAQVASLALRPGVPTSAIVKVRLHARSDLLLTLTAEIVSLVPGSLVLDISRTHSSFDVHVIDVADSAAAERARRRVLVQERRIVEAFASDAELAAYRRRVEEAA